MALPTCNEDMNIISKLDDEPNDVGGLSAAALKAKFDLAGNLLKKALNDLVAALGNNAAAKNIGFTPTTAVNKTNVQDAIENVQSQIAGVSQGGIADASVTAAKIADGAVGTAAIADGAITAGKLAMSAVETDAIKWGAVDAYRLKDGAVTEAKLSNGVVTESKIGYYAVTEKKIASKAVTSGKIANDAVSSLEIASGSIVNRHVSPYSLGALMQVAVSSDIAESAVTVQSRKFVYVQAIGIMLFQLSLRGLSSAEITDGVLLTLSGLTKLPSEMVSCAARVQYVTASGAADYVLAPALLSPEGYLTIKFPDGVVANANDSIMLSGWYFC